MKLLGGGGKRPSPCSSDAAGAAGVGDVGDRARGTGGARPRGLEMARPPKATAWAVGPQTGSHGQADKASAGCPEGQGLGTDRLTPECKSWRSSRVGPRATCTGRQAAARVTAAVFALIAIFVGTVTASSLSSAPFCRHHYPRPWHHHGTITVAVFSSSFSSLSPPMSPSSPGDAP